MTEPLITALLPVKEFHPPFARQALQSVFRQTSPRWRLILVTEEETGERLRDSVGDLFADERVRVVVNEGRKLAGAINTGMRMADTEFVAILLGDDLWAPEAVEVLERAIQLSPEVDFFHSSRQIVDEDGRPLSGVYPAREGFAIDDFVRASPVKHLLCWRRLLALSVGGLDERLNSVGPDDYDFPWTMAEAGATFRAVPECLYLYRDHRESYRLTTHLPISTHARELRRILRKHGIGRLRAELRVLSARRRYLRQCLYRNELDRIVKERLGRDSRGGWREPYKTP